MIAVPMPLLRRREGFLGTFALSLSVLAIRWPATPGVVEAGPVHGTRRTAIVEAVEKTQPCVVNISSEKKAASNSRWPFLRRGEPAAADQRDGKRGHRRSRGVTS